MRFTPRPPTAFWNSAMCGALKCAARASGDSHSSKMRKRPRCARSAENTYAWQPASRRVASCTRVAAAIAAWWLAGSVSISPAMTSMGSSSKKEDEGDDSEGRDEQADGVCHAAQEARHPHACLRGQALHKDVRPVADVGVGAHQDGAARERGEDLVGARAAREEPGEVAAHERNAFEAGRRRGEGEVGRRV